MKFTTIHSAIAALAISPLVADAWSMGRFPTHRGMMLMQPPTMFDLANPWEIKQKRQGGLVDRAFTRTSPRYEIIDNEEMFQVALDVPGVKAEDINVSIEEANNVISISGRREAGNDQYSFTSKFSQSFYLDPTVDVEQFAAQLENGVLVVSAPKDIKRLENGIRKIPVQSNTNTKARDKDESATASSVDVKLETKSDEKMQDSPSAKEVEKEDEKKKV